LITILYKLLFDFSCRLQEGIVVMYCPQVLVTNWKLQLENAKMKNWFTCTEVLPMMW